MKVKEILEAAREVATKVKTPNLDTLFTRDFFAPSQTKNKSLATKQDQAKKISQAVAAADTRNMPSVNVDQALALANDQDEDEMGFDEPTDEPSKLPARLPNKDVLGQGEQRPDWLQISQLPGYMQQGIRAMGKTVFGTLTKTKIKDINILVNLQGGGPNTALELNAVAGYARKTADHTRDMQMTFGEMIPDYSPDAKLYVNDEDTHLVIRDEMGDYIYQWPTSDTKQDQFPDMKNKRLR